VLLWRITRKPFLTQALEGLGAKKYGGRWNSKGFAVVYTSESLELAVLEALVHLDIDLLPKDVFQVGFELDDQFIARVLCQAVGISLRRTVLTFRP
jgi:RES domain-containing protein